MFIPIVHFTTATVTWAHHDIIIWHVASISYQFFLFFIYKQRHKKTLYPCTTAVVSCSEFDLDSGKRLRPNVVCPLSFDFVGVSGTPISIAWLIARFSC